MPRKKTPHRGHGEGSYQLLPSGRWRGYFTVSKGQRITIVKDTRPEILEWLDEQRSLKKKGLSYSKTKTTLREFMEDWLSVKAGHVKGSTTEQYRFLYQKYVDPELGDLHFRDMTTGHYQRLYSNLLKNGVGRTTIERVHGVLHGAFQHAIVMGLAPYNYVKACIVPRPEEKEMKVWSESEMSLFILASREHKMHRMFRFALFSGVRLGELLALKWQDVNWERKSITIQRQVIHPKGGGFTLSEPKTRYGHRQIGLTDEIIELLREQQEYVDTLRLFAGKRWQENDLIFPSAVGTPFLRWNVERNFREIIQSIEGLTYITIHGMRHTNISHKLAQGVDVVTVSREAGHASPAFTYARYAHFIEGENQRKSARVMAELTSPTEVFFDEIVDEED